MLQTTMIERRRLKFVRFLNRSNFFNLEILICVIQLIFKESFEQLLSYPVIKQNMIVAPSHRFQTLPKSLEKKTKLTIPEKSVQTLNSLAASLKIKKRALASLVESVKLDIIQEMISTPVRIQNSEKEKFALIRKQSTDQSENDRANCQDLELYIPQEQNYLHSGKSTKGKNFSKIESCSLYFKLLIEQKTKNLAHKNAKTENSQQQMTQKGQEQESERKLDLQKENNMTKEDLRFSTLQQTKEKNQSERNQIISQTLIEQIIVKEIQGHKPQLNSSLTMDEFEQISMLGEGSSGRVSLARHKKTNLIVALKKISKKGLTIEDSTFLGREIKIQSFADHPNIVQLYTFFHDSDDICLVLQVCNEGNLFDLLKKQGGRFTEEKTKKYIRQICKAIQFLHSRQIIHRDLKPENILVHNEMAKICDFGWAIHAPQLRDSICGTPLYSSPEIVKNEKYDNKIDIWNIGIMTYELICGRIPFDIQKRQDLTKIVNQTVEYPQDGSMSQQCKSFISGCLQKNPKDRLEIWELLRHPFINVEEKIRESLRLSWIKKERS